MTLPECGLLTCLFAGRVSGEVNDSAFPSMAIGASRSIFNRGQPLSGLTIGRANLKLSACLAPL
jgi:hypothetical protein